jgi:GntR family transcriptional regulator
MLVTVNPHSGVPVYRQIVDQMRFQVTAGVLEKGDEVPSTRALSLRLGVNPMTVSKAYGILEGEGILVRRVGLSLVVAEQPNRKRDASRTHELEMTLKPAVLAAIQLGVSPQRAADLFRLLIEAGLKNHKEEK